MTKRFLINILALLSAIVNLGRERLYGQFVYQPLDIDTTLNIDAVNVTAKQTFEEIIPIQILEGDKLKNLSTLSVADAVRYFSGVQVKDYGGIGGLKTVNIRSLGSNHVGVFYDGVEIGNAQNGVVDLGRFSLDNMEAISLYNGQKSAIFQSAKDFASSSSIYMTSRTPTFTDDKIQNLSFSLKGGSFKTINPSALWERRLTDRLSLSVSGEFMYTSGEYEFSYSKLDGYDTTEVRQNGDVRSLRLEAALFGKLQGGKWQAKVYYYNSERGYPGAAVREEPGVFKNQDRQWDDNLFVQGSFNKKISNIYSLQIKAKYAYDYLHYLSDPRLDVSTMYVDNTYIQQEGYLSASNLFTINRWWSASIAVDGQINSLDADLSEFVYPTRYMLLSAAATSLEFDRFKVQASLLHTYVNDQTRVSGSEADDKSIFSPTIIASSTPFSEIDLQLRAFYKRCFRMPTLNDLYYTFIGSSFLDPEYTTQCNLGATYGKNIKGGVLRRIELQADAYYNEVEDKIIAMPTSNQFRWTMLNLGYVEIRGIDVVAQGYWLVGDVNISSRLTYTYQKAQDFTDPESTYYGGQIPYVPWHSGSAIVSGEWREWGFNYSFIYTGERYESVANIAENYSMPWYTHDISLSRNVAVRWGEMRITAELNNVLNQQYEVVQWYPMPGINWRLRVDIKL